MYMYKYHKFKQHLYFIIRFGPKLWGALQIHGGMFIMIIRVNNSTVPDTFYAINDRRFLH